MLSEIDKRLIYAPHDKTTMSYRIPKDERLVDAIFVVMYRNQQVRSQTELARLVRTEIQKDGGEFRVSNERVRMLAVKKGLVNVHIDYHELDDPNLPDACPVCRGTMNPVRNMTIYGESREIGRKCAVCPYSVGTKRRVPGRYIFSRPRK